MSHVFTIYFWLCFQILIELPLSHSFRIQFPLIHCWVCFYWSTRFGKVGFGVRREQCPNNSYLFLEREKPFPAYATTHIQILTSFSAQGLNVNKRKISTHISDEQFTYGDLVVKFREHKWSGKFSLWTWCDQVWKKQCLRTPPIITKFCFPCRLVMNSQDSNEDNSIGCSQMSWTKEAEFRGLAVGTNAGTNFVSKSL